MEYIVTKVPTGSVDLEKAMNNEPTEVKGVIHSMGVDGFLTKQMVKANKFEVVQDYLTGEQLDMINEWELGDK